jgi:hypothetical protein
MVEQRSGSLKAVYLLNGSPLALSCGSMANVRSSTFPLFPIDSRPLLDYLRS